MINRERPEHARWSPSENLTGIAESGYGRSEVLTLAHFLHRNDEVKMLTPVAPQMRCISESIPCFREIEQSFRYTISSVPQCASSAKGEFKLRQL
jgi:hypothetical protein